MLSREQKKINDAESRKRAAARAEGENIPYLARGMRRGDRRKPQQHGTVHEYKRKGCRCDLCKNAMRSAGAKYCNRSNRRKMCNSYAARKLSAVREAKNIPCTDCGERYPYYVMEFDHLYDKKMSLNARGVREFGYGKVLEEIKKCEPVCSNCHAIRTHMRQCPEKSIKVTIENYNLQFDRWSKELPA